MSTELNSWCGYSAECAWGNLTCDAHVLAAEAVRLREHSVMLNHIGWQTALALGEAKQGEQFLDDVDIEAQHQRLIDEVTRLRTAMVTIGEWDCLNPPQTELLADLPWLRRVVDQALWGP